MMRKRQAGFSLLELLIATSLSSMVLVALVAVSASMVRFQADNMKKGKVTGWSINAQHVMNMELQDYNVICNPHAGGTTSDTLCACQNWSRTLNEPVDMTTGAVISTLYYCYESGTKLLRRYKRTGTVAYASGSRTASNGDCPAAGTVPTGSCNGSPGENVPVFGAATFGERDILGMSVERDGNTTQTIFTYGTTWRDVRVRYSVGTTTSTATETNLQQIRYDFTLPIQQSYDLDE